MFRKDNYDLPIELYNHIFSFLSNRDLCNINLTCTNALSVDDIFWKRKSRIEFNAELYRIIGSHARKFCCIRQELFDKLPAPNKLGQGIRKEIKKL